MKRLKSINKHRERAWKVFSEWVRRSENGVCFTCGVKKHWKEMDAGHFRPRSRGTDLYINEVNVHCQCTACNRFKHGNLNVYAEKIVGKYGIDTLTVLNGYRHPFKPTRDYWDNIYRIYTDKLMRLNEINT